MPQNEFDKPEEFEPLPVEFDPKGDYLTVAQAAALLGINVQSARNAAVHGNLKSIHAFGRILITRAALDEYKQRTQQDGRAPTRGRPRKPK